MMLLAAKGVTLPVATSKGGRMLAPEDVTGSVVTLKGLNTFEGGVTGPAVTLLCWRSLTPVVAAMMHLAVKFAISLTTGAFSWSIIVVSNWRLKVPLQNVEWVHSCPSASKDE